MKKLLWAITKNEGETRKFAELFSRELLKLKTKKAPVVGLEGGLGAGKTVFAKGFARGLGLKEEMTSPTFILMRVFKAKKKNFFHIDTYRDRIDFREFLKDSRNILLVEWSDKVKKFLPRDYFKISFKVLGKNRRELTLWR
ncbi:MAG: tRNA (adenosine(37)-N6)-threonylcarbamoyltransferase complex ATPase subunit type 1 TsaE [bacterium]|nr:tRNA (adenosine(37)-N6)-threonylcarbamoyltransferase complex ATPase subunit type 1 TsaE [bacterium]